MHRTTCVMVAHGDGPVISIEGDDGVPHRTEFFLFDCRRSSQLSSSDRARSVMAGPIEQFEIKPLVRLAEIAGHEISFTNASAYMVLTVAVSSAFLMISIRKRRLNPGDMPFQGLRRNPLSDSLPDIGVRRGFDSPSELRHNITYLHADTDHRPGIRIARCQLTSRSRKFPR